MLIATIVILFAGAGNFAMHRWMLESGHPMVETATAPMRRVLGRHSTYVLEFGLFLGALWMAQGRWFIALILYGIYTAMNAATVALIKGRPRG
ncbi:MAG: hypothetical protein ABL909_03575 [Sphingopyxis sp.]